MVDHFDLTLPELAEFIGIPERTLRLYQTKGLLGAPIMRGRVGHYNDGHVRQLRIVKSLIARGFPLAEIAHLNRAGSSRVALMLLLELREGQSSADDPASTDSQLPDETARLVRERDPALLERLLGIGIVRADDAGTLSVDALGIAVVSDLLRAGIEIPEIAEFIVAIGEIALTARPTILAQVQPGTPDPQLEAVLIDAATVTFRETLSRARRR